MMLISRIFPSFLIPRTLCRPGGVFSMLFPLGYSLGLLLPQSFVSYSLRTQKRADGRLIENNLLIEVVVRRRQAMDLPGSGFSLKPPIAVTAPSGIFSIEDTSGRAGISRAPANITICNLTTKAWLARFLFFFRVVDRF
ncbi:MAG: hypothetical protein HPY90_14930 [Syntrophothermus sp.]|uniref:hypothetical protein n=1 Tax=Syntrophothermus sp. TaxID=2736299 RepID=UPI00257A5092|nr:hypothetical protein [Syntrophothermus sp.]NSW84506.1 hypothetical protein [Syntrophothermus sp.]